MSDATWSLQVALKTALDSVSPSVTTYDSVPDDAAFPYVVITDIDSADVGDKTTASQQHIVTFGCWSRYRGFKEAQEIADRIYDVLHEKSLSIAGFSHVQTRFQSSTRIDVDELTRAVLVAYEIETHA